MYFSYAMRPALRRMHAIDAEASVATKVAVRMDRRLRAHGVRSYRGYMTKGRLFASLHFDDFTLYIGPFGGIRKEPHDKA